MRCRVVGLLCVISIGAGCAEKDQSAERDSVTCGQIRADDSWRSVAPTMLISPPTRGPTLPLN